MACRIFFPQNKGLNPGPSSESASPNHCTAREFWNPSFGEYNRVTAELHNTKQYSIVSTVEAF